MDGEEQSDDGYNSVYSVVRFLLSGQPRFLEKPQITKFFHKCTFYQKLLKFFQKKWKNEFKVIY